MLQPRTKRPDPLGFKLQDVVHHDELANHQENPPVTRSGGCLEFSPARRTNPPTHFSEGNPGDVIMINDI